MIHYLIVCAQYIDVFCDIALLFDEVVLFADGTLFEYEIVVFANLIQRR